MNQKILNIAIKKFGKLKRHRGFINVGVDNWRGYRFIFDTADVRKCKNDCSKCSLYLLLKNEKEGIFSATLYLASREDKKLFGSQKYLNCKTLEQYKNCYVNFLIQKTKTKKEVEDELRLIKNFRIIFSKESKNLQNLERNFKKYIVKRVLKMADKRKQEIIKKLLKK